MITIYLRGQSVLLLCDNEKFHLMSTTSDMTAHAIDSFTRTTLADEYINKRSFVFSLAVEISAYFYRNETRSNYVKSKTKKSGRYDKI